ncbi:MAG: transcription antitermination factor NusB [Propionibacteriaceae bacterium]
MAARSKARKRALDVLYESDLRGTDALATAAERLAQADPPVSDYAVGLVAGVVEHRERIDELIATNAEGWSLTRMPAVDRNILRIGVLELLWRDDIPDPVAISEAVALARAVAGDDTPKFVNGLLGRLLLVKPQLAP